MKTIPPLTEDEWDLLILALGEATGAAFAKGNRHYALKFIRLANSINRDNPNWTPYHIPTLEPNHDAPAAPNEATENPNPPGD